MTTPWTPPGESPAEPGSPPAVPQPPPPPRYQAPQAYPYGFQPPRPAYPGGPHPDGIPPSKTMAGWALVLCIVGCTGVTWIVGVVLAVIVLVEGYRDPRDRGKGMAIAALVIAGLWALTFVAGIAASVNSSGGGPSGTPTPGTIEDLRTGNELPQVSPSKLRVGDCFDDAAMVGLDPGDDTKATSTVTVVPCPRLHDLEAYDIVRIEGETYPGPSQVEKAASQGCAKAFKPYVGVGYGRSGLDFWAYYPTEKSWTLLDDHVVTCVLGDPDAKTAGSLKDSRR